MAITIFNMQQYDLHVIYVTCHCSLSFRPDPQELGNELCLSFLFDLPGLHVGILPTTALPACELVHMCPAQVTYLLLKAYT